MCRPASALWQAQMEAVTARSSWVWVVLIGASLVWAVGRANSRPAVAPLVALPSIDEVLGRPVPPVVLLGLDSTPVALQAELADGRAALWFFSSSDCLYCLAEVSEWKEFKQMHRDTKVVAIASGPDLDMIKAFAQSESLGFPVYYDPRRTVLTELGITARTPLRILTRRGSVVLIRSGTKSNGMSFLQQVSLLYDSVP